MLKRFKNFLKIFQKQPVEQQTYEDKPWFEAWASQPNPKPLKTAFKLGFTGLPASQKDREIKALFNREHWNRSLEAGAKARREQWKL